MKATIYHNSRCSKSRRVFEILEEHGVELKVVEYLKTPPSKEELQKLLLLLDTQACQLLRKNEDIYKEKYQDRTLSDDECLDAMVRNPILIERPIVVVKDRAIIGRPPERVLELLSA